jgi:hypothetical protein
MELDMFLNESAHIPETVVILVPELFFVTVVFAIQCFS